MTAKYNIKNNYSAEDFRFITLSSQEFLLKMVVTTE